MPSIFALRLDHDGQLAATQRISAQLYGSAPSRSTRRSTVSLDQVIKTMRETGAVMMTKYKETAHGGLAVNIVEC